MPSCLPLQQQQRHQLCQLNPQHVHHSNCWQTHAGRRRPPPAAAQHDPQLTVESKEEDSAAKAVAADLRSSGPQRSIHTAAERQQHSLHLQQAITARSSVMDASVTQSPAFEFDSLSSAAVAAANAETSEVNRRDIFRAIGISGVACVLAGVLDHEWVEAHKGLSMSLLFTLGYIGIFVEEIVGLNKSGVALLMAVSLWTIYSDSAGGPVDAELSGALASVSELIFFVLGAMTIVEAVDTHGGFNRLAAWVQADQRQTLTWFVALLTFCMSAVLDNLTTTIVMISVLQRAVPEDPEFRRLLGAIVVIAANAGGAFTVIGDVTTTMLWIHGQITPWATMRDLVLPSLVCTGVPVAGMCASMPELQGPVTPAVASPQQSQPQQQLDSSHEAAATAPDDTGQAAVAPAAAHVAAAAELPKAGGFQLEASNRDVLVLSVGVGALLFVPVFKYLTGLPPYMGMLSGLAVLWLVTDALHFGENKQYPRVQDALRNVDIGGVMFFMGILLSVEALNAAGLLSLLAANLNEAIPDVNLVAVAIGLASAVIDNVPLVAGTMGMYDVSQAPPDAQLWQLIALCAGTGGSLLVIGSAAGVAYMGLEGIGFVWYLKRVTPWALAGYAAANACYLAQHGLPS